MFELNRLNQMRSVVFCCKMLRHQQAGIVDWPFVILIYISLSNIICRERIYFPHSKRAENRAKL